MNTNTDRKPAKAPWFKDPSLKDPKQWGIAFIATGVCYLVGEIFALAFGVQRTESSLVMHVLQRIVYGAFVVAPIGVFIVGFATGKWPWKKGR